MKVAIVVQRYGVEVIGGAEAHARKLAEKLKSSLGWEIEVLTTCAMDYRTWANEYPEGLSMVNGIRVLRFPNLFPRWPFFNVIHRIVCRFQPALAKRTYLRGLSLLLERIWYIAQGPYSPSLMRFMKDRSSDYDFFLFFTYLYYPTAFGIQSLAEKSILVPTAHDEPPFYFSGTKLVFENARSILVNTEAEGRLIERIAPSSTSKLKTAGLGIDPITETPEPAFEKKIHAIGPYVLYLGRVDYAKQVHVLLSFFQSYLKKGARKDLKLVIAGGRDPSLEIPDHPNIIYLGFVSEGNKFVLMKEATAVINPSPYESLSLIVAEAMSLGRPVLVNGHSEVLRDYRKLSESVFVFMSEDDFHSKLESLLDFVENSASASALDEGIKAINQLFAWERILDKFRRAADEVVGGRS